MKLRDSPVLKPAQSVPKIKGLLSTVEPELTVTCINQINSLKWLAGSPVWSQYITGSLHKQVIQCITARKYCPKSDRYIQVPLYYSHCVIGE